MKTITIQIPDRLSEEDLKVEIKDGVIYIKEKFKDGDILISSQGQPFIFNGKENEYALGAYIGIDTCGVLKIANSTDNWTKNRDCRLATHEEEVQFLNLIKQEYPGKYWNKETKSLDRIRVKLLERYYFVNRFGRVCCNIEGRNSIDDDLYNIGNYFVSRDAAERAANKFLNILK